MVPFGGFDRGLLDGIAPYVQIHGPWFFYMSSDISEVPLPSSDSVSGKLPWLANASGVVENMPLPDRAGISEIRVDSYKAGVMAAEHFLDRGLQ